MNFNSISFPHPVLRNDNDDIRSTVAPNPNPEIISNAYNYSVKVNYEHDNSDLIELVNSGKAEYLCEVTCSHTLYRKVVKGTTKKLELEIPRKHVKGKVDFTCMLVAKSPIQNYKNSESHPDYNGYSFDIETGDVLAFFGEFSFNADINYEKLKAVSSFMEFIENKDKEVVYTKVDLSGDKIEIQLPSVDYNLLAKDSISKEPRFAPVFHSSIVMNALTIALYNFDSFKGTTWAKVIEYRLAHEEQFKSLSIDDRENIPEIVQRILGNPYKRMISELQVIAELPNTSEID